jgi:hypothetical protein
MWTLAKKSPSKPCSNGAKILTPTKMILDALSMTDTPETEITRPLIKRIDMAVSFMELAAEHSLTVTFTTEPADRAYVAYPSQRRIKTRPIKNTGYYVSGLHEIGHCVGKRQSSRWSTLMSEYYAWKWAMENAIVWTETADRVMRRALTGYMESATSAQRENMPDQFWIDMGMRTEMGEVA